MLEEKLTKKEPKEGEGQKFELQGADELMACVSVIDILAKMVLRCLRKPGNHRYIAETIEDLHTIKRHSDAIKHRLRLAMLETSGSPSIAEAKRRHSLLWSKIRNTIQHIQFLK
ncbi:MAG: hypothetical protein FWG75_07130 [Cystobacterineae bacterium]|nr:hypothetical protein [Cystobacterineae bacterium]